MPVNVLLDNSSGRSKNLQNSQQLMRNFIHAASKVVQNIIQAIPCIDFALLIPFMTPTHKSFNDY